MPVLSPLSADALRCCCMTCRELPKCAHDTWGSSREDAFSVQQFPLMTGESYTTMKADSSVRVSTIHCRLLRRLARFDMPGSLVKRRLISCCRHGSPP